MLTPYLDATCVPIAAISAIQAHWRGHCLRRGLNVREQRIELRAATLIQRRWRGCECVCSCTHLCVMFFCLCLNIAVEQAHRVKATQPPDTMQ